MTATRSAGERSWGNSQRRCPVIKALLACWLLLAVVMVGCARAVPTPTPTPFPLTLVVNFAEFQVFPQDMTVQVSQPVTMKITNNGRFPHDIAFHGMSAVNQKIARPLTTGESKSVQVTFDQPGLYPFYCSISDHQNRGMVGTLRVVGPWAATPSIKVRAPAPGGDMVGPQVLVAVEVTGFELDEAAIGTSPNKPGAGHWHLLLDGREVGPVGKLHAFLQNVAVGQHTIRAQLHNHDHSLLSPAVEDTIPFNVVPPPPTPRPATPTPAR